MLLISRKESGAGAVLLHWSLRPYALTHAFTFYSCLSQAWCLHACSKQW
jgi:hypothetical protein